MARLPTQGSYRSLTGDLTVYYCGDGGTFAPKGVLGGKAGGHCGTWKRHRSGKLERLPDFHTETVSGKEAIHFRSCAGGGYGSPRRRDPDVFWLISTGNGSAPPRHAKYLA